MGRWRSSGRKSRSFGADLTRWAVLAGGAALTGWVVLGPPGTGAPVAERPPVPAASAGSPAGAWQPAPGGPGRWHTGAPMPVEIAEVAAAAVEDVIYTGGGFTPPGGAVGRWFGRYDVTDDAWEARTDLPQAVHHHQLAAAAGRVWLAGGYTGPLNRASASNQLHAYDPTADRWTRMADMPGRRAAGFLVAQTDRLWLVGGIGDAEDRMWVYEIATDSWSERPGPTPREHLGAAAWDGWVFAVAGRGFGRGNVGTLEGYDIAAERWATLPAMPGQCGGCSAAVTADGRIHVTGGEGGGRTYNDHYVYDIATAGWSVDQPMPTARHGIGAAAVGSRFYVIGGGRMQGLAYSNLVEWWEPAPASPTRVPWPTPTAGPSPTTDRTVTPPPFQTPSAFGFLPALLNGQP